MAQETNSATQLAYAAFVEKLWNYFSDEKPEILRKARDLDERTRQWPDIQEEMIYEEFAAVALFRQILPRGSQKRECAAFILEVREQSSVSEANDEAATYAPQESKFVTTGKTTIPEHQSKHSKRNGRISYEEQSFLRSKEALPALWRQIRDAATINEAIEAVHRHIPTFTPLESQVFLAATGFAIAIPTAPALAFLTRYGFFSDTKWESPKEQAIAYRDTVSALAGSHTLSVTAVDFLIHNYCGSFGWREGQPVCGRKPRCNSCYLKDGCRFAESLTERNRDTNNRLGPVHQWPASERPRERILGAERLTDAELIALLLGSGTADLSAVEMARKLLENAQSLSNLANSTARQIMEFARRSGIKGLGEAKAARLCAAFDLGRRSFAREADERSQKGSPFRDSGSVFERFRARYMGARQEEFVVLLLDTKHRLQREVVISKGTLDASIVHPRDVFRVALEEAASAVIFIHNHPSGDPQPSNEDRRLTARLVEAGQLLGIRVLDHIIIGAQEYYSFADKGEIRAL